MSKEIAWVLLFSLPLIICTYDLLTAHRRMKLARQSNQMRKGRLTRYSWPRLADATADWLCVILFIGAGFFSLPPLHIPPEWQEPVSLGCLFGGAACYVVRKVSALVLLRRYEQYVIREEREAHTGGERDLRQDARDLRQDTRSTAQDDRDIRQTKRGRAQDDRGSAQDEREVE